MTSEFFKYHWFWNRTKIATYRRSRGAYDIELDTGAQRCFQGGGCLARIATEFRIVVQYWWTFNKLRPNGRTSVWRRVEIDIPLFARVIQVCTVFWDTRYTALIQIFDKKSPQFLQCFVRAQMTMPLFDLPTPERDGRPRFWLTEAARNRTQYQLVLGQVI